MRLAKTRLMELCEHGSAAILLRSYCSDSGILQALINRDLLQKYGVRIRFIGRREMLPPDVRKAVEDMERLTMGHNRYVSPT